MRWVGLLIEKKATNFLHEKSGHKKTELILVALKISYRSQGFKPNVHSVLKIKKIATPYYFKIKPTKLVLKKYLKAELKSQNSVKKTL